MTTARDKDVKKLEKEINKVLDSYTAEREERVQELNESLERRIEHLKSGKRRPASTTTTTCGPTRSTSTSRS